MTDPGAVSNLEPMVDPGAAAGGVPRSAGSTESSFGFMNLGAVCCGTRTDAKGGVKEVKDLKLEPPSQVDELKAEVEKSEEKKRESLAGVQKTLSDVAGKLESAETKFAPWSEIKAAKSQLTEMQSKVGDQINEADEQLAKAPNDVGGGFFDSFTEAGALQKKLSESTQQRRTSLKEVSESLASLGSKLEEAESSWKPSGDILEAKIQVREAQGVISQVQEGQQGQEEMAGKGSAAQGTTSSGKYVQGLAGLQKMMTADVSDDAKEK